MQLTTKLTAAITAGMLVVLALDAGLRVKNERAAIQEDIRHDVEVVAQALRRAAEHAWREEGETGARALLREAERPDATLRARWVWLDAAPGSPDAPALRAERGPLDAGRVEVVEGPDAIVAYAEPRLSGPRHAAVEVLEPLAPARAIERQVVLQATASAALLGALAMAIASVAGSRLVGRPIASLAGLARRVAAGDLDARVEGIPPGELGDLGRDLNSMCEHLAEARARTEAATEQLRHADRLATAGQLAAGLAHELGTPLNVVAGRAKLIASSSEAPDRARDDARIIGEQAGRMTAIIRQLLDFTRRRQGDKRLQDLRPLARRTVALLGELADRKRVTLAVDAPDVPVEARVDGPQLEQVLTNLLVNAVQAMPDGGTATVSVRGGLDGARLAVEDVGVGIPPEHRQRVFEPFFTTKDVGEGTGLGLAVVHGIVSDHGGRLELESEVGRGTRVTVHLPAGASA